MTNSLYKVTTPSLRHLSDFIVQLSDTEQVSLHTLQQLLGQTLSIEVSTDIDGLKAKGWSNSQIGILLKSILETREMYQDPDQLIDLVLSGPDVTGFPIRDTAAVTYALTKAAEYEIILVSYAVYNAKSILQPIAERMLERPNLKVRMCLNIARNHQDSSLDSQVVYRFIQEFYQKHWPWNSRPDLFYDPYSLSMESSTRRSLHAKCVIVDRRVALITSANVTEAAQSRNIEVGVVVKYLPTVERIAGYFDALCDTVLRPFPGGT